MIIPRSLFVALLTTLARNIISEMVLQGLVALVMNVLKVSMAIGIGFPLTKILAFVPTV